MFRTKLWVVAVVLTAATACKREAKPVVDEPADTYRTRVQVESVSGSGDSARAILSHEAIEAFKNREGEPERMPAMKMAFGLAPGVDASSLTPGSKHEVTFDVVWGREPAIRVIEASPLPDDTQLLLSPH